MQSTDSTYSDIPSIAIQVSRDAVVASIQIDLNDEILARFGADLLQRIHETDATAVIFDLSGLNTLDSAEFAALRRIVTSSEVMGTRAVMVGLQPGVVSSLIEVGANVSGLTTAIDLDAAYALLQPEADVELEPEPESEAPTDAEAEISERGALLPRQSKEPQQ